ncbi:MAG: hypothetical protein KGK03_06670 [Candidatus Omnitrophica bacterium]|nr:hypothetical protein [Candidatus Omnitrophota bacterium]
MRAQTLDNDTFVKKNFEKLILKYPRQVVIICEGELFTGKDAMEHAERKHPGKIPMVLPVPSRDQLKHFLL